MAAIHSCIERVHGLAVLTQPASRAVFVRVASQPLISGADARSSDALFRLKNPKWLPIIRIRAKRRKRRDAKLPAYASVWM